jgi:protein tyrosine/serine phosphatase
MKVISLFFSILLITGCKFKANFHEVDPGRLYRSGQLKVEELTRAHEHLGIKTIINLRGKSEESAWYQGEAKFALDHGIKLIDIGMSAKRLPHRDDLIALLDAFKTAERPILIHCLAGADRSGEASAIYMMEYMSRSKKEALKQLTPKYHHLPKFTPAKRYFIWLYQGESWARTQYDPCKESYRYYDQTKFCKSPSDETEQDRDDELVLTE